MVLVDCSIYVSTERHPSKALVSGKADFNVSFNVARVSAFAGKDTIKILKFMCPVAYMI